MRRSDRELLARMAGQVQKLGKTIEDLQRSQEATLERLKAVEDELGLTRRTVKGRLRSGFAQFEDILALYHDIGPETSLPRMRDWAAGAELQRFLFDEVTARKRTRVVECGSGTTTVILAYALRALGSGRVTSLDHSEHYASRTRRELSERGLSDWAEVVHAPLSEVTVGGEVRRWYDPAAIPDGGIDLLLIDGPPGSTGPEARYPAFPLLVDRLSEQAIVVLDDAKRPDEKAVVARWIEEYPRFASRMLRHERGTVVIERAEESA